MTTRRTLASTKTSPREPVLDRPAKPAKAGNTAKPVPPSQATTLLNDLRPSMKALHERVEKLRLRFA